MSKRVKIDGKCPYCGTRNKFKYCDLQDFDGSTIKKDIIVCMECLAIDYLFEDIKLRKINNRRSKVVI